MGASKKSLMRYRLIDEILTSKRFSYPSLGQIIDYVNEHLSDFFEDGAVSKRTIQKDLQDMRFSVELDFLAPIEYDLSKKGYYYEDEDFSISKLPLRQDERQVIELVANMLSRYEKIPMFSNFKHITQKIFDALDVHSGVESDKNFTSAIQFDTYPESKGNEWLASASEAIKKYRKLHFTYQPFGSSVAHKRTLHPYILKEFKGRWYLIGISEKVGEMRTYALDRIIDLEIADDNFPLDSSFDRKKYFEHSFGIYNLSEADPQEIVLEFDLTQGFYVLSRPIHPTQKLVEQSHNCITVSLNLYVSEDLIMEILSYGDKVKVLTPAQLKNEVKGRLKRAALLY